MQHPGQWPGYGKPAEAPMSAPKGTGRVRIDDRGNSVWEFTDTDGGESTVRTERVLALGDELSLVQTGVHAPISKPAPSVRPAPAVAPPAAPAAPSFAAMDTKPPRKPMSRQELQKLSEEIVRQRQLREAMQKKGG
jgi:hypothetical protein